MPLNENNNNNINSNNNNFLSDNEKNSDKEAKVSLNLLSAEKEIIDKGIAEDGINEPYKQNI